MESLALLLGISFQTVNNWISAGGYVVLFGLLFACGLGLPLPEDIPLIVAGALVAKGHMSLVIASICAWCGIIGGDIMLYHLGKKFGLEITRVPFIGKHVTQQRIRRVEQLFENYGVGVVAVGRLFAGIRGAMVVCAGAIRYNFVTFLIADGLAALISGGLWVALGYWVGNNLTEERIHRFKEWIIAGALLLVLGFVLWIIWSRRHSQQVIEAEAKVVAKVAETAKKIPHPHVGPKPEPVQSQNVEPDKLRDETAA
jgi:membrane protein DedA with SNARE-associated domain